MTIEKGPAKGSLAVARKIFDQAIDLAPGEQATFLDTAVGGDAQLRAYVAGLLAEAGAEDDEDGPWSSPVVVRPPAVATLLRDPSRDDRLTNGRGRIVNGCLSSSAPIVFCGSSPPGAWALSTKLSKTTRAASSPSR